MATNIIIVILAFLLLLFLRRIFRQHTVWKTPTTDIPKEWRMVLLEKVLFYNSLNVEEKKQFEFKVHEFLLNCRIIPK